MTIFAHSKSVASILTVVFLAIGAALDIIFGSSSRWWMGVERVINLPVSLALYVVGPGHGVPQLVIPFVFSVGFYWGLFWILILGLNRISRGTRSDH